MARPDQVDERIRGFAGEQLQAVRGRLERARRELQVAERSVERLTDRVAELEAEEQAWASRTTERADDADG